jgi:hypothetical protein
MISDQSGGEVVSRAMTIRSRSRAAICMLTPPGRRRLSERPLLPHRARYVKHDAARRGLAQDRQACRPATSNELLARVGPRLVGVRPSIVSVTLGEGESQGERAPSRRYARLEDRGLHPRARAYQAVLLPFVAN